MKNVNNDIKFSTIDIETGETQDGYIDHKGNQKFKKKNWFQKLFNPDVEPEETEYLGTIDLIRTFHLSGKQAECQGAVYRVFNPYNNKTKRIYCKAAGRHLEMDINAYYKDGSLVII